MTPAPIIQEILDVMALIAKWRVHHTDAKAEALEFLIDKKKAIIG